MEIKRIHKPDEKTIREISRIHYSVLTESFLNNFGLSFLEKVYTNLLESPDSILLVSEENEVITGYALAFTGYSKFFRTAICNNRLALGTIVIKKILQKPSFVFKIASSLFNSTKEDGHAELQFIAIIPESQGKNIGTRLINLLNEEFRLKNITNYYVGTKAENPLSNQFYRKLGFKQISTKQYFGDKLNFYISPNI
ncbi:MAG: GNAT family N-acetyltransferase [Patescibacteria group bacterium]